MACVGPGLCAHQASTRPRSEDGDHAGCWRGFCVYVYCGVINAVLFGIPTGTMLMVLVWGLVQYAIAAVAGACLQERKRETGID